MLILIFLLGLWLRWSLNGTWRLGPDEALYSTWARTVASGADPWLGHTPGVDKPPLQIYSIAGSMLIYGYFEFASRFPALIASGFSIVLTYALAARLYHGSHIARLAALLVALSPFAILYAPTAYADPPMVMWILLAAVLATRGRWGPAGIPAALAVLTKQEAPLLLPIVIVLGLYMEVAAWRSSMRGRLFGPLLFVVVTGVVAGAGELLWESGRAGQPSPFGLGLANYGGLGLVTASEILPRLGEWWGGALRYVFVSPVLNLLLVACTLALAWQLLRRPGEQESLGHDSRPGDAALLLVVVYIILARTLVGFQLWNRYMLVAVPLLCILLARELDSLWRIVVNRIAQRPSLLLASAWVPFLLVGAIMIPPVSDAMAGRIAVGSDHGMYWGIDDTARFVRENVPPGSVIYHHSLGWQLGYYLYGAHLDFWWYPCVDWLAQTAAGRAEQSQYVVVPDWERTEEIATALAGDGLALLPAFRAQRPDGSVSFVTYRIAPAGAY